VHGNDGDDLIDANDSDTGDVEDIFGDADDDTIDANDGEVDDIDCGSGNDTVIFDAGIDIVDVNCNNQFPV
jgi:Ca2+-binding RTX toxin-like protein